MECFDWIHHNKILIKYGIIFIDMFYKYNIQSNRLVTRNYALITTYLQYKNKEKHEDMHNLT